jgi:hypothetical protein
MIDRADDDIAAGGEGGGEDDDQGEMSHLANMDRDDG